MTMRVTLIVAAASVICGCSGAFVTSKEADLEKYPELRPFIHQMLRFHGEDTDLEYGVFRFSYESREQEAKTLLAVIDTNATSSGWQVILRNDLKRGYSKNLQRYPAQTRDDRVWVEYDAGTRRLHVEWH